jgi:hypothetical protein
MTTPDETNSESSPAAPRDEQSPPRVARPVLEREAPIRNWSTLFGAGRVSNPPATNVSDGAGSATPGPGTFPGQTLSDAVGQGYRVINDYLAQGQRHAENLRFPDWATLLQGTPSNANSGTNPALSTPEMQQLMRRTLQYGWDFAGLWFEMWNRIGWPPPGAVSVPPGAVQPQSPFNPSPEPAPSGFERATAVSESAPDRVLVSITSEKRTESVLELRRGASGPLIAHALRPEGHDAPAIRGVTIQLIEGEGTVRVSVEVPSDQPPGIYNGMIVDSASNLPRGTLTVKVADISDRRG